MPSAAHYSPVARWAHNPNPTNLRKPLIERSGARPMDEPIRKGPVETLGLFFISARRVSGRERSKP